jgi:peptidoglycan hydrolase-like protein with peptidoglycan-binding domain
MEFEKLSEAERRAIQDALVWTGDHTGVTTGGFGPRTFQAISAYQRRAKLTPDGVLDAKERAGAASGSAAGARGRAVRRGRRRGHGRSHRDSRTPAAQARNEPEWRGAMAERRREITLDTRAVPAGETDLAALYERNLAIQTPGRQVTYSVLRPDFFVITGETPTGKFYLRYAAGPSGLRGFSLGYDKALAKEFDRTVIAIANSFEPFPGVIAAAPAAVAPSPAPAPPARPATIEPPRPAGPIATGLAVAPRTLLTTAAVEACPTLRVGRAPARVMRADKAVGLALLELEAERAVSVAPLRSDPRPASRLWRSPSSRPARRPQLSSHPAKPRRDRRFSPRCSPAPQVRRCSTAPARWSGWSA